MLATYKASLYLLIILRVTESSYTSYATGASHKLTALPNSSIPRGETRRLTHLLFISDHSGIYTAIKRRESSAAGQHPPLSLLRLENKTRTSTTPDAFFVSSPPINADTKCRERDNGRAPNNESGAVWSHKTSLGRPLRAGWPAAKRICAPAPPSQPPQPDCPHRGRCHRRRESSQLVSECGSRCARSDMVIKF